jgi:hypothetical protein
MTGIHKTKAEGLDVGSAQSLKTSLYDEPWLKSTNDFALLGIKFLYLSNAGAIIAILANLNNFVDEDDYPTIIYAFSLFVVGLICALLCNLAGYLMYRNLLIAAQTNHAAKKEKIFGNLCIIFAVLSLFFFAYGAYQSFSVIEAAL